MDRRVIEVAQLAQIKYTYDLFEALELGDRRHAMAKGYALPRIPTIDIGSAPPCHFR